MLAALSPASRWTASSIEIDRAGPTYTVDTLRELAGEAGMDEPVLIMGQDALEDLPNWREPDQLVALATFAVAVRGEEARNPAALDELVPGLGERVTWLDMPLVPVSATQVRKLAAAGTPLGGFVPASVEAYIKEHGLYTSA